MVGTQVYKILTVNSEVENGLLISNSSSK